MVPESVNVPVPPFVKAPPVPLITPANVVLLDDDVVNVLPPRLTTLVDEALARLPIVWLPAVMSNIAVPAKETPLEAAIEPVLASVNVPALTVVAPV